MWLHGPEFLSKESEVEMEGSGFYEELSAFRERRLKLQQMCFENGTGAMQRVFSGKDVKSYSTRKDLNSSFKFLCKKVQPVNVQAKEDFCELKAAKPTVSSLLKRCTEKQEANLKSIINPESYSSLTTFIRVT